MTVSRKFIDLIWQATAKWASWDPGYEIKVGDYGKIDKATGVFEKKGNIYVNTEIFTDENVRKVVLDNPPKYAPRDDQYIATSSNVKRTELKLEPNVNVVGLAEAAIKGEWTFGSKRGALLVMAQPRSVYIPHGMLLEHLVKVKALEDMHLVTEVFSCPAYSLYLSSGNDDVVKLALLGSAPIPHVPGVSAGARVGIEWWSQFTTGLFRHGREPQGEDSFTPLYMLKEIRKKGWFKRGLPPPVYEGDDLSWEAIEPPWEHLDEEGNEDTFEDTVFE
uniref:Uncharacterized protein n=1 Tax=Psilocybe cubensis TaxID=181762 RepID=A0A8H7XTA0_PSICU